jgi:hypothetical protein
VATAAFGCPAAGATVLALRQKFNAEMTDTAAAKEQLSLSLVALGLSPRDCPNDKERLFARYDGIWEGCVWRLVRQIFLAGEEAQKGPTLLRDVIPDRALQHGVCRFDRIEHRALCDRTFHLNFDFVPDVRQGTEMLRQFYANGYCHFKNTFI